MLVKHIKTAYDTWHERKALEEAFHFGTIHPWHRTVERLLPDLNGSKVLEVGCGRGDFSLWLAAKYPHATIIGVDFSEAAITIAADKQRAELSNVSFAVGDAEDLKFGCSMFDYVVSCECLEHVRHPDRMAREIARVLKPEGKFILTTENYFNGMFLAWVVCWLNGNAFDSGSGTQPCEHFFLWWHVKRILENGGLRIEHMESNHFQWLLLPRFAPSRLCTEDFSSPVCKRLFRPFGRHFTYQGSRSSMENSDG
jgi:ubiquinone/menaquinone biosynthesis C-methylase UbiE